jgi:xylan 1,4-beta-xylosidase
VTLARSQRIEGPYELAPTRQILTARDRPDAPLQRAGHADLVETQGGETYAVYLCGRPIPGRGRCILGRESAIPPLAWTDDGWLQTTDGQGLPQLEVPAPDLPPHPFPPAPERTTFEGPDLPIDFQWLRSPEPERLFTLTGRALRLHGRETIGSLFEQALVARRLQAHCASVATGLDFAPAHYQQAAGLVCYYNASKFHYLMLTHDADLGTCLQVMSALPDQPQADAFTTSIPIEAGRPLELRAEIDFERLRFGWRYAGEAWRWLPEVFDASILSDEATAPGQPNFTGAFVGMACQDTAGTRRPADFAWFDYRERAFAADPR